MAQEDFTHISLEEDEEEIYIVGAAADAAFPVHSPAKAGKATDACGKSVSHANAVSAACAEKAASTNENDDIPLAANRPKLPCEDERDPSVDDLQSGPMPFLQKVIIAVAMIGVVVLVAYLILS